MQLQMPKCSEHSYFIHQIRICSDVETYRMGLVPLKGLSGRMCRMSRPSGRRHDVTLAPCMLTCTISHLRLTLNQHTQLVKVGQSPHTIPDVLPVSSAMPDCQQTETGKVKVSSSKVLGSS